MIGYQPSWWWKLCWTFTGPLICVLVFIGNLISYTGLENEGYKYPWWGELMGWLLALSSMAWIPGYAIWLYYNTPGTFDEVREEEEDDEEDEKRRCDV